MPNWFPWIIIGGIVFILLGWIGTRYKERTYHRIQTLQDFISGAICIGLVGVVVPDLFPSMDIVTRLISSAEESMMNVTSSLDDEILQVGPPRLVRS